MKIKRSTIIVIGIALFLCILAAFPRAIEVVAGNYLFGYDQGKHWLGAKSIVIDHKFPLIGDEVGGRGGFFQGPGWYYLQAIPFFLFQGDPYGQLFLMFVIGIVSVLFSFILFSKLIGRLEGFFISFLIAVSPSITIQSRFAWPPFIIPFIALFYSYNLYGVMKGKMASWFFLFFSLGMMAHFEIATTATLGMATCIVLLLNRKIQLRNWMVGVVGFILPLFPLVVFDLRHQFLNLKGILNLLLTDSARQGEAYVLSKNLIDHLRIFQSNLFGTFPIDSFRYIFVFSYVLILIVFLLDKRVNRENKRFLVSLILIPVILFIALLFYRSVLWDWWILELPIFYIIFIGVLSAYIYKKSTFGKIMVSLFYFWLFVVSLQLSFDSWKRDFADYGGTQKIRGRMDAIDAIYKDAAGTPFGIFVFCPPIYTYPYDYLFWWAGTKKYSYVPHREKKGLFYLLVEPDGGKPWTYKGWMETVIKDGTVLSRIELPSGFIIEKRIAQ